MTATGRGEITTERITMQEAGEPVNRPFGGRFVGRAARVQVPTAERADPYRQGTRQAPSESFFLRELKFIAFAWGQNWEMSSLYSTLKIGFPATRNG